MSKLFLIQMLTPLVLMVFGAISYWLGRKEAIATLSKPVPIVNNDGMFGVEVAGRQYFYIDGNFEQFEIETSHILYRRVVDLEFPFVIEPLGHNYGEGEYTYGEGWKSINEGV